MARRWPASPFSSFVMFVALAVVMSTSALAPPLAAAAPAKRQTPAAPAGARPVNRALPAGTAANHGYPKGNRPPVVPPGTAAAGPQRKLSAAQWAAAPKPAAKPGVATAAATGDTGATGLILRSGFDFNDTSLVLYFNAADPGISGWSSWLATVYDPTTGAAQDSRVLQPSDATVCQVPAQYCRSFGSADGWSLTGGQQYYATITVTFNDGTQVTSPASAPAAARTTADPPAVPNAQLAGCSCSNSLFPTTVVQATRGSGVATGIGSYAAVWPDLQLAGFGVTFDSVRTYDSANTTAGVLGVGWAWSYDMKVIPPSAGQTSVTVRAEDGAQAVFTAGTGGTYNRPPGVRSTLSAVSGGGWKLVTPVQGTYTFDATGRLVSILDTHGHGITLAYASGSITLTDAAGRVVTATLSSAGLLTRLALPDKRNVIFKYTNGMLTSAMDAASNTWTYGYTNGLLTTVVDPQGRTQLTNTYSGGRITKQVDASGAATTFGWDATKQEAKTVDADGVPYFDGYRNNSLVYSQNGNGDTTNQRYDQEVNPNLLVDPEGNQTAGSYDPAGNLLSMTAPDPFNFQTGSSYDGHNNLTTHTDALGHVTRYGYTATDEVASIQAPVGDSSTLAYDSRGLLTKVTDPRGKSSTYSYDAAGNLISQTSPMGEVTTYTYDSSGRLLTKVDPRGNVAGARALDFTTTYTYDNLDRVTSVLQPRKAHASMTTYDSVGQVTRTIDPVGHTTSYTYLAVIGRTATATDPNGGITTYTYTAAGREASVTDPVGDKTTIKFDNRGNVSAVTAPKGNVTGANPADFTTTYTYDFNNNRVRTSHPYPGGGTVTNDYGFDQLNRPTSNTDSLGRTELTGYDNNSNVISASDPLGGTTTYSYDDNGRPTATLAPAGGTSSVEYDLAGNVTKSTSATGGVTTYTYNDDGKVATMVDPRGNAAGARPADYTVTYGYDPAGNLTTLTDQLGKVTTYTFDANNRVTAGTDPNGHTTTYKFLDDDTLQSVVGPDGQTSTTYSYDNAGNVVARTDARGNTRFTYDKLGRIIDMKDPLNRDTLFSFDADGNQTQSVAPGDTDPSTRTIAYSYDILDRLTSQNQANGALVYNWGYDANNRVTSMADPTGVRTQTYDNAGRLSSVSRGSQTFSYGYDGDGNVTSRTWPDGTSLNYTFDGNDNVSSLTVQGGQTGPNAAQYTFGYDPSGRLNRTTYPTADHMVTDRTYDRAGRLSDLNSHSDNGTVARYQVTRDAVGNPTGITTARGSNSQHVAYTYDVSDRVTAACVGADCATATGKTAYTYDGVGNRLSQTLTGSAGNTTTTYQYDSASELTSSTVTGPSGGGSTTYAYNRSGDLVQAGASTYTYNLDHTLASASINGTTTSYGYDAQGIQLAATSNSTAGSQTRTWQDDVNNSLPMLAEQTTTNAVSSTTQGFVDNPTDGSALGMLTGGQADSYAPDTLHGVANVVDPAGSTLAAYDYDPFGKVRTDGTASGVSSSVSNPIGFAGGYQDSTLGGQISSLSRVYDQNTGRFDSVDPVASAQRQPAVSPYAYVGDRSTSFYDPSGAAPCSSNDDHDQAQMFALDLFKLQYGPFNVYGDCPGYRIWRGVPGRISLKTTVPASNPDILVNAGNNTLLYEVKPMANQLGQICRTCGQRGDNNAYQVQRYLWALAYDTTGRFPNPQPGPNIAPATRPTPDGGQITIFSGVDWNKYAPPSARPDIRNAGIIYYVKTKPPRNPVPPPVVQKTPGGNQTEEPKQNPRQVPTTQPADNGAEQVLEKVLVTLLEIILIALLIVLLALVIIAVVSIFAPVLALFA